MNYETVIGLEVHAQLRTRSKMYCPCSADYANTSANTHVCPVCLGMPGVLPAINQQAIEYTVMTALALNCTISDYTKFDRKNYPYPDLMKGYQISQYDAPIGSNGWLAIEVDGQEKRIDIWWRGLQQNGDLMLLLAHLLKLNLEWKDATIVVRSIVESEDERNNMEVNLSKLVPETRIQAKTEVIVKPVNATPAKIMHNYSRTADIVFLGLMEPKPGTESKYAKRLIELASGFNTTVFVRNAGEFAGHLI